MPPSQNKNFQRWFGGSKTVDAAGNPMRFYHGSARDFNQFDVNRSGSGSGSEGQRAIFVSSDPQTANHYAEVQGAGYGIDNPTANHQGAVYPVYVSSKKPYISKQKHYNTKEFDREIDKARRLGHDSVSFPKMTYSGENGTMAVFNPNQIKSAIGNNGEYSTTDADITKSVGGSLNPEKAIRAANMIARRVGRAPGGFVAREKGQKIGSEELSGIGRPGHVYRGMTHDEYNATLGAGKGIKSSGKYSHASEGTNFAEDPASAESYVNFGRDDPRITGKPNYLVEAKADGMTRKPDGYYHTHNETEPTRIWAMHPRDDAIIAQPQEWRPRKAGGGSLSDAINSFSKEREDSLKRPASGSAGSDAALLAMLRPHPQLAIAEPEDSRRRMAPSGQVADLGAQIDEGAHWLAGEPADDDNSVQTSNSSVASGHQVGNSPPVVSGARQSAVRRGSGPALITTQSFEPGAAGSPSSQNGTPRPIVQGRVPSGGNPNYHYAALNNPGNIGFGSWAQNHGAVTHAGWDTGHAIAGFPDLDTGYRAMSNLALGKYSNGATSLNRLIAGTNGWTPGNGIAAENIARYMGVSPNEDLRLDDPARMRAFQRALTIQETGSSSQFDAWNHPRNQQAASAAPTSQPNNPPPPQMGTEAPLQLQDSPPQTQEIPLGGPSAQATPPSPQAQADPMSNMFDRMAMMPEVASGYDSPQVLYQPDQARRGGYIRRAAGGPAYAPMPTNELIARALEILRKHRDTGGSTSSTPTMTPNQVLQAVAHQTTPAGSPGYISAAEAQAASQQELGYEPVYGQLGRVSGQEIGVTPIQQPWNGPSAAAPAAAQTPVANNPAVAAGTVGNAAGATGSPIGIIPMAAPTQPPPPDWNNTLDQALQTNNPTMNQIFGFNYPQNLPSPKPQPQGPVSQDEINALYGFGGGSQMGTGTFQSGGAIIMDALNRARRAKGNKRNV